MHAWKVGGGVWGVEKMAGWEFDSDQFKNVSRGDAESTEVFLRVRRVSA
jgi:hypothetical protein